MIDLDVDSALAEIAAKSERQIEEDTACKWAARAVACFVTYQKTKEPQMLLRAEHYSQEAIEHAALCKDRGATVADVQDEIDRLMKLAQR